MTAVTLSELAATVRGEVIIDGAHTVRAHAAALHLLIHPTLISDPRVWRHVTARRAGHLEVTQLARIDFDAILDEKHWPVRERTLIEVAAATAGADVRIPFRALVALDLWDFAMALEALAIGRGDRGWPSANDDLIRERCRVLAEAGRR